MEGYLSTNYSFRKDTTIIWELQAFCGLFLKEKDS
jgi:hypothetical protein